MRQGFAAVAPGAAATPTAERAEAGAATDAAPAPATAARREEVIAVPAGRGVVLERAPLDPQRAVVDEDRATGAHAATTTVRAAAAVGAEALDVDLAQVKVAIRADREEPEVLGGRRAPLEDRATTFDRDGRDDDRERGGPDLADRVGEGLAVGMTAPAQVR